MRFRFIPFVDCDTGNLCYHVYAYDFCNSPMLFFTKSYGGLYCNELGTGEITEVLTPSTFSLAGCSLPSARKKLKAAITCWLQNVKKE